MYIKAYILEYERGKPDYAIHGFTFNCLFSPLIHYEHLPDKTL